MGLFVTTENKEMEDARNQVEPSERICPSCKQPFTSTGQTLSAWNGALGIEGHKCPHCGSVLSFRRPSPDGL
jgi:ssDNA-binding Zn-finger/Zn-ribbon topoisomerase 1